jgi:hypothetical protein
MRMGTGQWIGEMSDNENVKGWIYGVLISLK